ncbi:hypothetical protein J7M07_06620 [bacterium]|nr:hypothetical protein [bacterium]
MKAGWLKAEIAEEIIELVKPGESKADEKAFSLNEIIEGMLILLQSTG